MDGSGWTESAAVFSFQTLTANGGRARRFRAQRGTSWAVHDLNDQPDWRKMDSKQAEHPDDIVHRPHGRHALTEQATLGAHPPSRMLAARNWRAAALLGLISSSYSTLINQLGAARVGRDAA